MLNIGLAPEVMITHKNPTDKFIIIRLKWSKHFPTIIR